MGDEKRVREEQVAVVRSVVGGDLKEMEIIRALHMANNDAAAAINIILDTPRPPSSPSPFTLSSHPTTNKSPNSSSAVPPPWKSNKKQKLNSTTTTTNTTTSSYSRSSSSSSEPFTSSPPYSDPEEESDWWLIGSTELAGLSTCKGRRINPGDQITFSFPKPQPQPPQPANFPGQPRRTIASCSEIVRFSSQQNVEIGRIPNEWARCLIPLVNANKIRINGFCKSAPQVLTIMDTLLLSVSIYINCLMFRKHHQTSTKPTSPVTETSTVHPLPTLFRLLGLKPFKKADFSPDDLYTGKRSIELKESSRVPAAVLPLEQCSKLSFNGSKEECDDGKIPDQELENIVGLTDSSLLEEMTPPNMLQCELRPYQKQALHWMVQVEKGRSLEEEEVTLHPCWDAYRLPDKRQPIVYLNVFSGYATTEFPSTLQIPRGGILADAMGLGKTIMTIALLLAYSGKGSSSISSYSQESGISNDANHIPNNLPNVPKKSKTVFDSNKLRKFKAPCVGGGSLVICPMTLLGQWKAEIETHASPGSLTVYVHYGQSRLRDAKFLAQNDVVLTTYGVLASEFSAENSQDNGGLYSVHWFRVVLDEAHTIKSSRSQISIATAALAADRRWCLTGTPIQNNLEDIFSLVRFLRIEPWGHWGLWHKLVQKPYEEGDERGLKLVQAILKQIMLRRTKSSTDRDGRPILVLPPAHVDIIYCDMTEAEKDFYEALFKRSKVKFDQFVEQGRILHNYASILELLLRLRQCCDHPFLVLSRGDTHEFSDLNKLAKRFLRCRMDAIGKESRNVLSEAYIKEVVEELRNGEESECPICLEAFEDAVLTPCGHRLCRECLLASWRSATTGTCPVCRAIINRQDLLTAPTDSRFQIDVEKNWVESSKISILLHELERLRSLGSKSILFSQWTAFLDLLQIPLSRKNFTFVRLDGTLNQQQREKVISQFTEDDAILILLMSLKAGGVGINLTAASNAFLLDPWWNPAVEEQAVMRIHRIGQTRPVSIKRFIVKGTVEERMEAVQARKQKMISGALTDQEVRTARIEELKMLFA